MIASVWQLVDTHQFLISVMYSLLCALTQRMVMLPSFNYINSFSKLDPIIQKCWYNKAVSSIHATIMLILTFYYWIHFYDDSFSFTDSPPSRPNINTNGYEEKVIYIMMGYILYDTYYEIMESSSTDISIVLHHIIGFASHSSTLISQNKAALFYCMVVYLAEISTPFLNISWLLHNLAQNKTSFFKVFTILLPTTFLLRSCAGPYALYHMIRHRNDWGDYQYDIQTRLMFDGNFLVILFFSLLNIFWLYKLIKIALGAKTTKSKKKAKE